MAKQLISVSGRAETGISRPFLCDDETGQSLFVKRGNVSWDQLVKEFLFGHLAQDFGIQVAGFQLVQISELLAGQSLIEARHEFDPGIGFASVRVPFGEDLAESHLRNIADSAKIELLCFDWWVGNTDRRLTFSSVSSNLLWEPEMQVFVAIDHDSCLDATMDEAEFFKEHIFREVRPAIEKNQISQLRKRFEKAVNKLDNVWGKLPAEWVAKTELSSAWVIQQLLEPKQKVEALLTN